MIPKKLLKEIVNKIIDFDHAGTLRVQKSEDQFTYALLESTYSLTYSDTEALIPIPEYDGFVEDMKGDLLLDLSFVFSEWEKYLARARYRLGAAKTNFKLTTAGRSAAAKLGIKRKLQKSERIS